MVFVAFFLLRFLGQGAMALVSQHALAMWFHRRLGTMHALIQVAVFGLWILAPQAAVRLIDVAGWRETYIIFGLAIWVTVIPVALLLVRNRPEDLGLHPDGDGHRQWRATAAGGLSTSIAKGTAAAPLTGRSTLASPEAAYTLRQALRTRAYWTLTAVYFLSPLIGTAFLFDMQPMLLARDMSLTDAANAVSAWTATMGLMAIPSGVLTDRVRPSLLIAGGMSMIGLSALILMFAWSPAAAVAGMVAFGVGQSITATCASATLARYFGRRHHGAIRSSTMRLGVIGTGMGTVFTGVSVAVTGGYTAAMVAFMLMCVPVVVAAGLLAAPKADGRPE
jgi:MFS transporter, OFA family, oxalate/formate antiporter